MELAHSRQYGLTGLVIMGDAQRGIFQAEAAEAGEEIAKAYESCNYNRAMRLIMELADRANPFVEEAAPWVLRKDPEQVHRVQDVCTVALNLFRQIMVYLSPVVPELVTKTEALLRTPITHWDDAQAPLTGTPVAKFKHMLKRVEEKDINAMIEESKEEQQADQQEQASGPLAEEPIAPEISFDDFMKVDLRTGKILEAEKVKKSKKLIQLKVDIGTETRQILAGIAESYEPEKLIGRTVVIVANLKPAKLMGIESQGMVLAASNDGTILLAGFDQEPGQGIQVR